MLDRSKEAKYFDVLTSALNAVSELDDRDKLMRGKFVKVGGGDGRTSAPVRPVEGNVNVNAERTLALRGSARTAGRSPDVIEPVIGLLFNVKPYVDKRGADAGTRPECRFPERPQPLIRKRMTVMVGNEYWLNHFDGNVPVMPILDVKMRDRLFNELVVAVGKPQRSDGRESVNKLLAKFKAISAMLDACVNANRSLGIVPVRLLLLTRKLREELAAIDVNRPVGRDPLN